MGRTSKQALTGLTVEDDYMKLSRLLALVGFGQPTKSLYPRGVGDDLARGQHRCSTRPATYYPRRTLTSERQNYIRPMERVTRVFPLCGCVSHSSTSDPLHPPQIHSHLPRKPGDVNRMCPDDQGPAPQRMTGGQGLSISTLASANTPAGSPTGR